MPRWPNGLGALLMVLAVSSSARAAQPDALTLEWSAPAGCPDVAYVRAEGDRLLGGARGATVAFRGEASFSEADRLWHGRLEMWRDGTSAERQFQADSCEGVADAVAVMVSTLVGPSEEAEATRAVSAPTSPPPVATPSPPRAPLSPPLSSRPVPDQGSASVPELSIGGEVIADVGALPKAAPGLAGAFAISLPSVRFAGGALLLAPNEGYVSGDSGPGGTFQLWTGYLEGCPTWQRVEVILGLCAGVQLGAMRGSAINVDIPDHRTALWVAATAGGFVGWRAGTHARFPLHLAVVAPLERPAFAIAGSGRAHPAALAGALAGAGVEVLF